LNSKTTFALARGSAQQPAMEMTKWFDTNYHYLVPELRSAHAVCRSYRTVFAAGAGSASCVAAPSSRFYLAL
jgi:5-methyltetrahydropteroyltriglutamate--homocysteine methyltransferase